ncbi:MAG: aspartate aminotransferase, partial [Planctomycetota bacterium]
MEKKLIAERTKLIDASGIRKVFALGAALDDPINFSIGQPDFDVPDEL